MLDQKNKEAAEKLLLAWNGGIPTPAFRSLAVAHCPGILQENVALRKKLEKAIFWLNYAAESATEYNCDMLGAEILEAVKELDL